MDSACCLPCWPTFCVLTFKLYSRMYLASRCLSIHRKVPSAGLAARAWRVQEVSGIRRLVHEQPPVWLGRSSLHAPGYVSKQWWLRTCWLACSGGSETLVSMWEIQREEREELLDAPLSVSDASEEEVLWEQDWHSDACSDGGCIATPAQT